MTKNKAATWLYLFVIFIFNQAFAAGSFVVSGQINKPDGTPLESATVNFTVEIKDSAAGSCVLWKETFANTDLTASGGNFGLSLGTGSRVDTGVHPLSDVFVNQKTFASSVSCPGGYTPLAGAERSLKISFDDSGGATQTLSSQSVKPVPAASAVGDYGPSNLAKVSGVGSSNVLLPTQFDFLYNLAFPATSSSTPCGTGNVLQYNGANWGCAAIGGSGTVTTVTSANGDITVTTGTSTPVLTLNSGTGSNQIVKLDASAKLPAVDGSALTNLSAGNLSSGTIPAARMPNLTGDVTSTGTSTSIAALARTKIASGSVNHVLINDGSGNLSSEASLAIVRGGTGATTANGALNALLPSQTTANGKVLTSDGTNASWAPSGGLPASAGTAATPGYAFIGNTNTGVFSPAANVIGFSNGGFEKARLDASGNFGIGTSAPGSTLDVKGTLRLSGSTSGYVGLAPAAAAGSTTYTLPSADGGVGQVLSTNGSGVLSWSTPAGGATLSSLGAASGANSIDSLNFAQTWNWSTATTQSPMLLSANALTTGSLLSVTTSNSTLNSTNGLLYVANTGVSSSGMVARVQANSTTGSGLSVLANGNVGVGTSAPASNLHLKGTGSYAEAVIQDTGLATGLSVGLSSASNGLGAGEPAHTAYVNNSNNAPLALMTNGVVRMMVDSSGNVGIGTSTPASPLQVNGTIRATQLCDSAGTNCKVISSGWGVGGAASGDLTGTYPGPTIAANAVTTPKLFSNPGINRLVATDGTTGAALAPLVCSPGNLLTWNVSTGWQCTSPTSLSVASAASVTGTVPVANGGTGTTTGSITGTGSLVFTAGSNSSIVLVPLGTGVVSLAGNTTATGTISASGAVDTQNKFTINSANAISLSTVSSSTIVGATSAPTAVTAQTAIGANALAASSGSFGYNTAVGTNALSTLTTGSYNSALGFGALQTLSGGDYNTAIGWGAAGSTITTGSNNTMIGTVSGVMTAATSNAVAVGYGANANTYGIAIGSGASAGIGETAIGSISSSGNAYFFAGGSERLRIDTSGDIGVGTTTPSERLEVSGGLRVGAAPATLTTVSGPATSVQTTLTVGSTSGYPPAGTLLVDTEAMSYSGISGTSFNNLVRGTYGTTPAGHTGGAIVNNYLATAQGSISVAPKMVVTGNGKVGFGTAAPGAGTNTLVDVNGPVKLGSAGTMISAMGVCQTSPITPTNTATTFPCVGMPANTGVAVSCSSSSAFTTPNGTVIYARATGTVDQIAVTLSTANAVTAILTCMWMKP